MKCSGFSHVLCRCAARRVWRDYFPSVDCIFFLVDSSAKERLVEAKKELDELLACEDLAKVPFVVLGNKIDLPEVRNRAS
mgnify:CR=1 FL=1